MSIRANNVNISLNGQRILSNFDFELPEKGIVGLSGPSGCGKTTLLHLLAGLIQPDSGSVSGIKRELIGVVFQEDRLLPWMTAQENLDLIIRNNELTAKWLSRMQLTEYSEYYPKEMSGGMKRRIAIARALAFDCDLLLLDEPFQGLDQVLKEYIYEWIRESAQKIPVILVSHNWPEILEMADRKYQASGTPLVLERIE